MQELPDGSIPETPREWWDLQEAGHVKCRNQLCHFMIKPEVLDSMVEHDAYDYTCPQCGLSYSFKDQVGKKPDEFSPGGTTNSGLGLDEMGEIGERVVQQMGQIPGYGPLKWWHKGGAGAKSHLDGAVQKWGVEVKTVNWTSDNLRGIIAPQDRANKNRAAQDPKWFAEIMNDPELNAVVGSLKLQGVLGVLVLLDFYIGKADIFVREMPYGEWIGERGPNRPNRGVIHFRHHNCTLVAQGVPFVHMLPDPRQPGFTPYYQRPEESSGAESVFGKIALDYAGDAFPASEPQYQNDHSDTPKNEWELGPERFLFFYANGELQLSPKHSHDELRDSVGVPDDHTGPTAAGTVTVENGRATWEVKANVGLSSLAHILEDYTDQVGWTWEGITNNGKPVADKFAPRKSLYYHYDSERDHLSLSDDQAILASHTEGISQRLVIQGSRIYAEDLDGRILAPLAEWAQDEGLEIIAGNDNVIKTIEDLEQWNFSDPNQTIDRGHDRDRQPSGTFKCPGCSRLFPNWHVYMEHRRSEEPMGDEEPFEDGKFPEINESPIQDSHTTPLQPSIFPIAYVQKTADKDPKDWLDAPVPFIYDIQDDAIYVGTPGERTSDIQGHFTPGGIVEGEYEPGGRVFIRTVTTMPYTVRHMLELWYYQHPEFEIRNVTLRDSEGKEKKLAASSDEGQTIRTLAFADLAAKRANDALKQAGGKVYVVGGAVRDLLLDKQPKDIDLLVQGVPSEAVRRALEALPGRVDLTGKDFGVYRYRHAGHEVEIALPRRERSTGEAHTDFDVQADHTMSVEEDLGRRDFTANAIAVDLDDGEMIDPYNGAEDIKNGVLRVVSDKSFEEDPLRVIRALVAHSRHGLKPDERTKQQMAEAANGLSHLPAERIQAELDKIMGSKEPGEAIRLAHDTGVLGHILPEVEQAWDFDQNNPHHNHLLGEHLVQVLERTAQQTDDPDVRLAALLHDIGKPESAWTNPQTGFNHYYVNEEGQGKNHETHGALLADQRLKSLRYPANRTERIRSLIEHHMYSDFSSDKGARKFLNRVGDHADDLLTLRSADRDGKGTDEYQNTKTPVQLQRELVQKARSTQAPTRLSELAISGQDLIDVGMEPGPQMGQVLNSLVDKVVENPNLNTREQLLGLALNA